MVLIGELALWVALLMAAWAAAVSSLGAAQGRTELIESGERAIHATLAMTVLAAAGLLTALITRDSSVEHVARFSSANLPLVYTLAGLWVGPAGSLLLWTVLLAACAALAARSARHGDRRLTAYVTAALAVILNFALAALCLDVRPYGKIDWISDVGMHPLLQHPGMVLHPPALYLGLASTAVPFALAVAALLSRKAGGEWMPALRRWVILSWLFQTVGILLGMWWAYGLLEWGDWARDAVSNGAALPWLITTVLLDSLVRDASLPRARRRYVMLPLLAFPAALYSGFIATGGVISFANQFYMTPIARWTIGALVVIGAAAAYIVSRRLSDVVSGMAVQRTDTAEGKPATQSGSPGLRVIAVGIVVLLLALAARPLAKRVEISLGAGASAEVEDAFGRSYRFTNQGVSQYNELNRRVLAAALEVARGSEPIGVVTSEQRQYVDSRGAPTFHAFVASGRLGSLMQDVRVSLAGAREDEQVRVRVAFYPLVAWAWIGGLIMVAGGVMLLVGSVRGKPR